MSRQTRNPLAFDFSAALPLEDQSVLIEPWRGIMFCLSDSERSNMVEDREADLVERISKGIGELLLLRCWR